MKTKKAKILAGVGAVLLTLIFAITLVQISSTGLPRVAGLSMASVSTGSMEPAIRIGDLIFIQPVDSYKAGDVVTYFTGRSYVTHRIQSVEAGQFISMGDANNTADDPTPLTAIEGKVVGRVPMLGSVFNFLKTPFAALVILGAGLISLGAELLTRPASKKMKEMAE